CTAGGKKYVAAAGSLEINAPHAAAAPPVEPPGADRARQELSRFIERQQSVVETACHGITSSVSVSTRGLCQRLPRLSISEKARRLTGFCRRSAKPPACPPGTLAKVSAVFGRFCS